MLIVTAASRQAEISKLDVHSGLLPWLTAVSISRWYAKKVYSNLTKAQLSEAILTSKLLRIA